MLFIDTVTFRKFGDIFRCEQLALPLRRKIGLSPITLLEVLSQLSSPASAEVLSQIRSMRNWLDPENTALLPWVTDVISSVVLGVAREEDITRSYQNAVEACFIEDPKEIQERATVIRTLTDRIKDETADAFGALVDAARHERPTEEYVKEIWMQRVAARVDVALTPARRDALATGLDAYWEIEFLKLTRASRARLYNARNHRNDIFDFEQLIYLSIRELHFLTMDTGFSRVARSPQRNRIHVFPANHFGSPEAVVRFIDQL
jgi:hypothetical protein